MRKMEFYKHYFTDFYFNLSDKVQQKIDYILELIRTIEKVPVKFLKRIQGTDGIYEIRIEYSGNIYRIFCFFDKGNIVVLENCFTKKTRKTPIKEIKLAEKLKAEYLRSKK